MIIQLNKVQAKTIYKFNLKISLHYLDTGLVDILHTGRKVQWEEKVGFNEESSSLDGLQNIKHILINKVFL